MSNERILSGSAYGNPRNQARTNPYRENNELIHGMTPNQVEALNERFGQMMPKLASPANSLRDLFDGDLPKGANWDPVKRGISTQSLVGGGGFQGAGGRSMNTLQRPYQPEYESPDRQQYPVHRILANRYWRLFMKLDPVIGTGLEMYGEMPWSDCKLTGEGVEGSIRHLFEDMWEETNILGHLPAMVREFMGVGEVCPHNFFDSQKGAWSYIALHNPDQLEVIDAPLIKMDPVIEFVPDDRLRAILTSSDPKLRKIRETMPPELIAKLHARQNIPINTEINATFIPRKMHPYDTRGTSIISRMWRILMYEDAIFNASIATARRHAGPIKLAKMGNPQTNWIPGPDQERRFAELVAQAEVDPHAWIIWNYGIALEAFGTTDRVMTINREWDIIERIKLVALGLSRSFLTGEVTFASATAGLQVFLRRLLALRNYFENIWIRPKFLKTISEINGFYHRDTAELNHRVRIKRSALEQEKRLIVPRVDWANKLNPMVDRDLISAYESLEKMGIRISKTKKMAVVALSFEEELRKGLQEDKYEVNLRKEYGVDKESGTPEELSEIIKKTDETQKDDSQEGGDKQLSLPGMQPPPNPRNPAQQQAKPPAKEPEKQSQEEPEQKPAEPDTGIWDESGKYHNWDHEEVQQLVDLLDTGSTQSAFWEKLIPEDAQGNPTRDASAALKANDPETAWLLIDHFLVEEGYPDNDIVDLKDVLVAENVLPAHANSLAALDNLPDGTEHLSDAQFLEVSGRVLEAARPFVVKGKSNEPRALTKKDNFLIGEAADHEVARRNFRISGKGLGFSDIGLRKIAVETPHFDPADNYHSREDWQASLHRSKIPNEAKRHIKSLENEIVDGWDKAFQATWEQIEKRLNQGQRIEPESFKGVVEKEVRNHLKHINLNKVHNAFTGLYSHGKDHAYKLTNYRKKKLDKLKSKTGKQAILKEGVTIDTHEDQRMLEEIKSNALSKVKSVTNSDLRQKILDKLTESGNENVNPIELANQIIKDEAKKRKEETDYTDEDSRAKLKEQLKSLYDDQQFRLQTIMRTEATNGFATAQLLGWQEQGIVKAKWNSHRDDPKVCTLCLALDGQEFEIETLLKQGEGYPQSHLSHPCCRCWFSPVIAYVTFDEFSKKWDETHPTQFVKGGPEFDDEKLDDSDIIKNQLTTPVTTFSQVPVEHVAPLETATKRVDQSTYSKYAPENAKFSTDVANNDDYQHHGGPTKDESGQISSWYDKTNDTLHLSSYASEFEPIGDVYIRNWSQRVWDEEPDLHSTWKKLYKRTPTQLQVPSLDPSTIYKLEQIEEPFAVSQTYFKGDDECLGLTKKFRECSDTTAKKMLNDSDITAEDAATLLKWRAKGPLWEQDTGLTVMNEEAKDSAINTQALESPEALFRESVLAYTTRPWSLERMDPDAYNEVRDTIFNGKEFKRK